METPKQQFSKRANLFLGDTAALPMVAFAAKPLNGLGPLGGRHLESASTCRWWRPPKCPGQPGITVRRGRPLTLRTADRVVAFMDRYEVVAGSAEAVRLGGRVARWP